MKNNKFKVGDEVVAITSKSCKYNPREAGKQYKVYAVHNCLSCGEELVCVTKVDLPRVMSIKCSSCGSSDFSSNKPWTKASHFSISTASLHVELQLAIEREDYEYAAKLRDKMAQQQ